MNKHDYEKITKNLDEKYKEISEKIYGFSLFKVDKEGCLLYSSTQENKWKNYKTGKILYDNVDQSTILNSARSNLFSLGFLNGSFYIGHRNGLGLGFKFLTVKQLKDVIHDFLCRIKHDKEYKMKDKKFQKEKNEKNYEDLLQYYKEKLLLLKKHTGISIFQNLTISVLDDNLVPFYNSNGTGNTFENYKKGKIHLADEHAYNAALKSINECYNENYENGRFTAALKCGQSVVTQFNYSFANFFTSGSGLEIGIFSGAAATGGGISIYLARNAISEGFANFAESIDNFVRTLIPNLTIDQTGNVVPTVTDKIIEGYKTTLTNLLDKNSDLYNPTKAESFLRGNEALGSDKVELKKLFNEDKVKKFIEDNPEKVEAALGDDDILFQANPELIFDKKESFIKLLKENPEDFFEFIIDNPKFIIEFV